jgi:hypothetical protein
MQGVPSPWLSLISVLLPIIISAFMCMILLVAWKRSNRADGNPELKSSTIFTNILIAGAVFGSLTQWCMGGIINALTSVDTNELKMIVLASLFTGPLSLAIYHGLRGWFRTRNPGMYKFLTVKHHLTADELGLYAGDASDMTVQHKILNDNDKRQE